MIRINTLIVLVLIFSIKSLSQNVLNLDQRFKQFAPVSPEAAKLMQEIDYPTNYSKGSIDLTIPIYTVQTRDLTLPINLKCNTSGIKLGEHSGWIALGWILQAEPIISREKKGRYEDEKGYLNYNSKFGSMDKNDIFLFNDFGLIDEQADIFYFNTLKNSGKFMFKRPENTSESGIYRPIFYPANSAKIITSNIRNGLRILDSDGTIYDYGNVEESREYSWLSGSDILTSWKATKIKSIHNDSIVFSYSPIYRGVAAMTSDWVSNGYDFIAFEDRSSNEHPHGYDNGRYSGLHPPSGGYWLGVDGRINYHLPVEYIFQPINDSIGYRVDSFVKFIPEYKKDEDGNIIPPIPGPTAYNVEVSRIFPKVLNSINYSGGSVIFLTQDNRLMEIDIYENDTLLKSIFFQYSIFDYQGQRRLDELIIVDKLTNEEIKYKFDYYDGASPILLNKPTKGIDYWGYYNGANNQHLVPSRTINFKPRLQHAYDIDSWLTTTTIGGADREPNIICQRQTLKSITYPTGLKDEFIYELHEYLDPISNTVKKAGGLRIKEVNSYRIVNDSREQIKQKRFRYKKGVIFNPPAPNFFSQFYTKIYMYGVNKRDYRRYRVYSSTSSSSLTNNMNSPVAYNYVEEINGLYSDTIKTVYRFDHSTNYSMSIGDYKMFDIDYLKEWTSGKLIEKKMVSTLGSTLQKEENEYSYHTAPYSPLNTTQSSYLYNSTVIVNYNLDPTMPTESQYKVLN